MKMGWVVGGDGVPGEGGGRGMVGEGIGRTPRGWGGVGVMCRIIEHCGRGYWVVGVITGHNDQVMGVITRW